jgi:hypothetical protein
MSMKAQKSCMQTLDFKSLWFDFKELVAAYSNTQ